MSTSLTAVTVAFQLFWPRELLQSATVSFCGLETFCSQPRSPSGKSDGVVVGMGGVVWAGSGSKVKH